MGGTCSECKTCDCGNEAEVSRLSRPDVKNSVITGVVEKTIREMSGEENFAKLPKDSTNNIYNGVNPVIANHHFSKDNTKSVTKTNSSFVTYSKLEQTERSITENSVFTKNEKSSYEITASLKNMHQPNPNKAIYVELMNPINETVNEVRDKLIPIEQTFDYVANYSKENPELGPYELNNDKSTYYGGFVNGQRSGYGTQIWQDGSIYEGFYKDDYANGQGRLINSDGGCYIGDFVNSKAHGTGEYFNQQGIYYKGEFKNNLKDGYGEEDYADGSHYTGTYAKGEKHGDGTFTWSDGSTYSGSFLKNHMNNYGIYTWSDGRVYEGQWKDNCMHGNGTFTYKDGRKYIGTFLNDKKNGSGEFYYKNGEVYKGEWLNGKRHGKGVQYFDGKENSAGKYKKGIWENGQYVRDIEEVTNSSKK